MMQKQSEKGDPLLPMEGLSGASCNDGRTVVRWENTGDPVYNGSTSKYWGDPKQGCLENCWFIAALVSVALVANGRLNTHTSGYQFFDTITNSWCQLFKIQDELPVDANGNLVYARTASGYIWPCLYEKAYAVWKTGSQQPDYTTVLKNGIAANALVAITGGQIGPTKTMPLFNPLGRPLYPTVASTNSSGSGFLSAGHEYSVVKKTAQGYQLRNPCGGGLVNITPANLTDYFKDWRYVIV